MCIVYVYSMNIIRKRYIHTLSFHCIPLLYFTKRTSYNINYISVLVFLLYFYYYYACGNNVIIIVNLIINFADLNST